MNQQPVELLVDEEICLRQFEEKDATEMFHLIDRNRAHLSQNVDDTASKYSTQESALKSIQQPRNPLRLRLGIWTKDGLVGSVNLTPDDSNSAEIGYYLGDKFQGRGYMTRSVNRLVEYAFENGINKVCARVMKDNSQSIAVLERAGFSPVNDKSGADDLYFSRRKFE